MFHRSLIVSNIILGSDGLRPATGGCIYSGLLLKDDPGRWHRPWTKTKARPFVAFVRGRDAWRTPRVLRVDVPEIQAY